MRMPTSWYRPGRNPELACHFISTFLKATKIIIAASTSIYCRQASRKTHVCMVIACRSVSRLT